MALYLLIDIGRIAPVMGIGGIFLTIFFFYKYLQIIRAEKIRKNEILDNKKESSDLSEYRHLLQEAWELEKIAQQYEDSEDPLKEPLAYLNRGRAEILRRWYISETGQTNLKN